MREMLAALTIPFGILVIVAPWVNGDPSLTGRLGGSVAGAALILAAGLVIWRHARPWSLWLLAALGAAVLIFGAAAVPGSAAVRVAAILAGLAAAALAAAALALPAPARIRTVNKGGSPLAEIKSLKVRNGMIAAPAVLLGSMPETVYVAPAELWKMLGAVGPDVIWALPAMLLRGRKAYLAEAENERQEQAAHIPRTAS
jgi:hypothetical protein